MNDVTARITSSLFWDFVDFLDLVEPVDFLDLVEPNLVEVKVFNLTGYSSSDDEPDATLLDDDLRSSSSENPSFLLPLIDRNDILHALPVEVSISCTNCQ